MTFSFIVCQIMSLIPYLGLGSIPILWSQTSWLKTPLPYTGIIFTLLSRPTYFKSFMKNMHKIKDFLFPFWKKRTSFFIVSCLWVMLMPAQCSHLKEWSWGLTTVGLHRRALARQITCSLGKAPGTVPVMQLFALFASSRGHSDKVKGQIPCFYVLASQ